jgi:ribosomal protein L40E
VAPDSVGLAFEALQCGGDFAGGLAFLALSAFESLSEQDLRILEGLVPALDPSASFAAGAILGSNSSSTDVLGGHALARAGYAMARADETEQVDDVAMFLSDPDATVRATVLRHLPHDLRAAAEAVAGKAAPASVVTCRQCGQENSPDVTSCARCNTVLTLA